jgi:hypothetical protein
LDPAGGVAAGGGGACGAAGARARGVAGGNDNSHPRTSVRPRLQQRLHDLRVPPQAQLDAAAGTVAALRQQADAAASELFEHKSAAEEERGASHAELELLQAELERADARLHAALRERCVCRVCVCRLPRLGRPVVARAVALRAAQASRTRLCVWASRSPPVWLRRAARE